MYEFFLARTHGFDHIKRGDPCEDYGKLDLSDGRRIFTAADGHGDSNCPRSAIGSEKACEAAVSAMEEFSEGIKENEWIPLLLDGGKEQDSKVRQLIISILARWVKDVNSHYADNPLTENEKAGCEKYIVRYMKGERIEHIYGTTLIAGLLTDEYLLLIQQGDGRCVVFDEQGNPFQPVPWDEKCFANVTTSLCDEDALNRFRYCVINIRENPVMACILSSDGVEDSFASIELMYSYYRDLLIYAGENGVEQLQTYLDETLPGLSENGSRDDITVCGFIDAGTAYGFTETFRRENEIIRKTAEIRNIEDRLNSLNGMGKLDALKRKLDRASAELSRADAQHKAADIFACIFDPANKTGTDVRVDANDRMVMDIVNAHFMEIKNNKYSAVRKVNETRLTCETIEKNLECLRNELRRAKAESAADCFFADRCDPAKRIGSDIVTDQESQDVLDIIYARYEEYLRKKETAVSSLSEARSAFEQAKREYDEITARKEELENKISELRQQIKEIRNA